MAESSDSNATQSPKAPKPETLLEVLAALAITCFVGGYLLGAVRSPNYDSVGGEIFFRKYVADNSSIDNVSYLTSYDAATRIKTERPDPDALVLSYECGIRKWVYTKGEHTVVSGSGKHSPSIPIQGIEFKDALSFTAGGSFEAYSASKTIEKARRYRQYQKAQAMQKRQQLATKRYSAAYQFLVTILTGFGVGTLGHKLGYHDDLNCTDKPFQDDLNDNVFWKGVAEIKLESLTRRYLNQVPPAVIEGVPSHPTKSH
jgi:hypothetical protein